MENKGKSIYRSVFLALLFLPILLFIVIAQDQPSIKIDTDLVNLKVVVLNKDGQRVKGLEKNDFEVYEDGVKQEITHFKSEQRPLKLVMLFDISSSMEPILPTVKNEAIRFVEGLSNNDRVTVISFASTVTLLTNWTDKEETKDAVRSIAAELIPDPRPEAANADRNTYLYEAFQYVFKMLEKDRDGIPVIVFSDGIDTGGGGRTIKSKHEREETIGKETIQQAKESWAVIYGIRYKTKQFNSFEASRGGESSSGGRIGILNIPIPVFRPKPKENKGELFPVIVKASGGQLFEFSEQKDLAAAVHEVMLDLRSQYDIAYLPSDHSRRKGFRKLNVRIKKSNMIARTRDGYLLTK